MKTKANTLIEDGQDVKVKNITTENIFIEGNSISIKKDDDGHLEIENQSEGIILKDGYDDDIRISDEGIIFVLGGEQRLNVTNTEAFFKSSIRFASYTTALRPIYINEGAVIYDSTLKKCILYNGTAWVNLDGTALA